MTGLDPVIFSITQKKKMPASSAGMMRRGEEVEALHALDNHDISLACANAFSARRLVFG
jgi:hypothetical protein